jgi:hypothetical protein
MLPVALIFGERGGVMPYYLLDAGGGDLNLLFAGIVQ